MLKGISKDATKLNSNNALECLTINAAKSLGMENKIGSVEKNKAADLIAINFNKIKVNQFLTLFRILLTLLTEKISLTHGSMENALWKIEMFSPLMKI